MSSFELIAGGVPDLPVDHIAVRNAIQNLEASIRGSEYEIPVPPVRHIFAPGVYCREMTIPAGVTVVGKIHRFAHVNVISQGEIAVVTEFGQEVIKAPRTWVSEPGTKRAVTAISDTIWMTVHPTEETDLDKIEAHVIAPDYESLGISKSKDDSLKLEELP